MGRSPKPLKFLVHLDLMETNEVKELIAKGHQVDQFVDFHDVILAPNAWKMDARLLKYLDLAIKAARGVKYPKRVTK